MSPSPTSTARNGRRAPSAGCDRPRPAGLGSRVFIVGLILLAAAAYGQAMAGEEKMPSAPRDSLKRALRSLLSDSARAGARPGERGRPATLPRPDSRRHSLEVDVEAVRADTVFAPFRDHLRAGRFDPARQALRAVKSRARQPAEREIAEFDLIELDFFEARFDTALAAYRTFATSHPRGYLTNDAIGRVFLIDENSDAGQRPLTLYAAAAREGRAGRPDSAVTLLKQGVELYPSSSLTDDLVLALGDMALRSATPAAALGHYRVVADSMPDSPLAPAAMMRIGRYRSEIDQDFAAAIGTYERVLERFPESIEADEARKLIERLRRRT